MTSDIPRRVLIFSHAYYPRHIGGAEVAVKEITDRIEARDAEFDMITINAGGEVPIEKIGNITVYRIMNGFGVVQKFLYPWKAYWKAQELHREKKYDTIWSIMASYAGYAGYLFKKKNPHVPFVLTIQEGEHFGRRKGPLYPFFKRMFVHADRIQAISTFLAEWSKEMGATPQHVTVVPNAVDYEHFVRPLSNTDRKILRERFGFGENETVIVTASRLVHKNAIDILIHSLVHLDKSYKLLILGSGVELPKLSSLVSDLRVSERVLFKGFVRHEELPTYLKASDVFVRPSRTEGLGNSFLEAMAAGIPVIGTAVGGIPDFLTDGETGFVCEVDNPRSIAQKVEKVTKDRESREYVIRRARDMVRTRYTWEKITEKMKEVLL